MELNREGCFRSSDGLNLFYRKVLPSAKVKKVVLLIHGWSEHTEHYQEFFEFLLQNDIGCFAMDLRGHGHSEGQRGYVSQWSEYLSDLDLFLSIVREMHPDSNLFLIGHSMGGLICTRFVQVHNSAASVLKGVALSAPLFKLALEVPRIKIKMGEFLSKYLPKVSLPNKIPSGKLTQDPKKAVEIEKDPLFHFQANSRWYTESVKARELVFKEVSEFQLPVLILHGDEDEVNALEGSQEFYDALDIDKSKKKLKIFPNMRHALFHELHRDIIYETVLKWVKKTI